MIEAKAYDGASVDGFGAGEFGNNFKMLIYQLLERRESDTEYSKYVERGEAEWSNQLRDAIFFDSNALLEKDRTLLEESINPPDQKTVEEVRRIIGERAQSAREFGESIEKYERREALCSAEIQIRVEQLFLKYALVAIAGERAADLSLDPLGIRQLEIKKGLKKTLQEAFLCWIFGFDRAAACLCGAAIESEIAFRLLTNKPPLIRKTPKKYWNASNDAVTFYDMLQIAKDKGLLGETVDENARICRLAEGVLGLRNDALHNADEFARKLKDIPDFITSTRDALRAIQTRTSE
jgi:hypothetical protein